MKIKIHVLIIAFICLVINDSRGQAFENPFANGKPIGLVFADFYTGINQGSNPTAFEVRRAYLGYDFNMSKNFSAKILVDIGSPDDVSQYSLLRRFAYFKNAYLQYESGKIKSKIRHHPLTTI
nr:hypothetical protein [Bacteroidota bacterium]